MSDFIFVPPVFSLRMEKLAHGADLILRPLVFAKPGDFPVQRSGRPSI